MPLSDRLDAVVDHKLTHVMQLLSAGGTSLLPVISGVAGELGAGEPGVGAPAEVAGEVGGVPVEQPAPVAAGAPGAGAGNGAGAPPQRRAGGAPPPAAVAPAPAAAPPAAEAPPAAAAPAPPAPPPGAPPVDATPAPSASGTGTSTQALEVLIRFIPVGVTSAYVAATAPIGEDQRGAHLALVLLFALLTGVTAWVGFAVRLRKRVTVPLQTLLRNLRVWPKWQMFAGIVAFVSWGFAIHPSAVKAIVPGMQDQVARSFAAIGVVIVGYLLNTFDELVV